MKKQYVPDSLSKSDKEKQIKSIKEGKDRPKVDYPVKRSSCKVKTEMRCCHVFQSVKKNKIPAVEYAEQMKATTIRLQTRNAGTRRLTLFKVNCQADGVRMALSLIRNPLRIKKTITP